MKKVYVTRKIDESEINRLREHFEVVVNEDERDLTAEELNRNIKGFDAVLCMLSNKITRALMVENPQVKIFANYAVGFNNMDGAAGEELGVMMTNTPGVLTDATADLAWTLLFASARRVVEADRFTREGQFHGWEPRMFLGKDITGKTLGIIGAGRIGQAMAKRASGFKMKILYCSRSKKEDFEKTTGAIKVDLETLLKESDYVSVHTALNAETTHLIGRNEFQLMKKDGIIINTSRGAVIDERALVEALSNREIFGAGLDVYENEPEIEPELLKMDNVVLLPHLGSATAETRKEMSRIAVENIIQVLSGESPFTPI